MSEDKRKGKMTVEEAGRMGGEKTSETHGEEFYSEIGHKGGQKVKKAYEKEKNTRTSKNSKSQFDFSFF